MHFYNNWNDLVNIVFEIWKTCFYPRPKIVDLVACKYLTFGAS